MSLSGKTGQWPKVFTMFIIYSILFFLCIIILSPYFILKMFVNNKYYEGLTCRFSIFNKNILSSFAKISNKNTIWMHTVSVGEFLTALPIINNLKETYPDYKIIITTTTKTGNTIAKQRLQSNAVVLYSPLDLGFIVQRFINLIKPKMLIIMETELWPNLIYKAHKNNIPIILLNGRISDKSIKNYKRGKFFFEQILSYINKICVQSKQDYERFQTIGASESRLIQTGNIKFDITPSNVKEKHELLNSLNLNKDQKIFVAGSTHAGEEELILETYKYLMSKTENIMFILAPRHPERINKVIDLINDANLSYIRRTQQLNSTQNSNVQVIILDTIGELFSIYSIASVVFIGGSMIPHGGHNILEPAYFSKPIIFGKYMNNFKYISDLFVSNNAGIMVHNTDELKQTSLNILTDSSFSTHLGNNANTILKTNQGAIKSSMEILEGLLQ